MAHLYLLIGFCISYGNTIFSLIRPITNTLTKLSQNYHNIENILVQPHYSSRFLKQNPVSVIQSIERKIPSKSEDQNKITKYLMHLYFITLVRLKFIKQFFFIPTPKKLLPLHIFLNKWKTCHRLIGNQLRKKNILFTKMTIFYMLNNLKT